MVCAAYSMPQATPRRPWLRSGCRGPPVRFGPATNVRRAPLHDFVQQAHAAVMGDMPFDPIAIQQHGSTWIAALVPLRYSTTTLPACRAASKRIMGSARAAGMDARSASSAGSASRLECRRRQLELQPRPGVPFRFGRQHHGDAKTIGYRAFRMQRRRVLGVIGYQQDIALLDAGLGHGLKQPGAETGIKSAHDVRLVHGSGGNAPISCRGIVHGIRKTRGRDFARRRAPAPGKFHGKYDRRLPRRKTRWPIA